MPANQQRLPRSAADGAVSWWRRRQLSKREWTIAAAAAAAFSVFIFILSPISVSRTFVNTNANTDRDTNVDTSSGTGSEWVPFTPLSKAQENSAFCLDGSVPGYHIRRGFGSGSDSWLLHVEEDNLEDSSIVLNDTLDRSRAHSSSRGSYGIFVESGGWCSTISSCSARKRTKLGSSSYMDREVQFAGILSHNPLQNPGLYIASHPDSEFKGVAKSLNHDCVTRSEPSKCFFPREFIGSIKTPVFLVQPAYDFWQIANILVPDVSDPHDSWLRCKLNIFNCDSSQLEVLHGYRNLLLKILNDVQQSVEVGMFVNSCFAHCQTWAAETWHSPHSPRINNKTIAESVGDWYFRREAVKQIDCPFPCNPTCVHRDLTLG